MSKFVEKLGWSNDENHELYKNSQKYENSRQFLGAERSFEHHVRGGSTKNRSNEFLYVQI